MTERGAGPRATDPATPYGRIVPFYEKAGSVTPNMQRRIVTAGDDQLRRSSTTRYPGEVGSGSV